MGAWPCPRPRLQAPAKPWDQTKAKFAMFPRQELFPGFGHLSNWPGSVSMFLIFPPQQREPAAREHPALIHLSVWSHIPSRTNFAFETFERALCSCIMKDEAWSTFCWKVFLTRISSTRKCCFVRIEVFHRNILFVINFLTEKNVSIQKLKKVFLSASRFTVNLIYFLLVSEHIVFMFKYYEITCKMTLKYFNPVKCVIVQFDYYKTAVSLGFSKHVL